MILCFRGLGTLFTLQPGVRFYGQVYKALHSQLQLCSADRPFSAAALTPLL